MSSTSSEHQRRHLTRQEVLDLLRSGTIAALEGVAETDQVDFKDSYDLSGVHGKRDLVSDVASFANHRGGVLVIGVRTVKDLATDDEYAKAPTGVHRSSIEKQKALALIRDHVRPLVRDVAITDHSLASSQNDRVVIAIDVPPQNQSNGPFVVQLMAHDDDTKRIRGAIGWPIRTGAETYWHTPDQIQGLLRSAFNHQSGTALDRRDAVDRQPRSEAGARDSDGLNALLEALAAHDDWSDETCLVVRASPAGTGLEIQSFFDRFRSGTRDWQGLRGDVGFNLHLTWPGIEAVGNARLRRIDSRVAVQISRDGEVLAAALGTREFLCLGSVPHQDSGGERIGINAFALVEFTTEALRFAFEYVGKDATGVTWQVTAHGRRFTGPPVLELAPKFGARMWPSDFTKANAPAFDTRSFDSSGTPGEAALALLSEIYSQEFDLSATDIPFQRDNAIDLGLLTDEANKLRPR